MEEEPVGLVGGYGSDDDDGAEEGGLPAGFFDSQSNADDGPPTKRAKTGAKYFPTQTVTRIAANLFVLTLMLQMKMLYQLVSLMEASCLSLPPTPIPDHCASPGAPAEEAEEKPKGDNADLPTGSP